MVESAEPARCTGLWEPRDASRVGVRFGRGRCDRERKFRYDLWGDTVNKASRMKSHGQPGMIHVTADIYRTLADSYEFQPRGEIPIEGRLDGDLFLDSPRKFATVSLADTMEEAVSVNGAEAGLPASRGAQTSSVPPQPRGAFSVGAEHLVSAPDQMQPAWIRRGSISMVRPRIPAHSQPSVSRLAHRDEHVGLPRPGSNNADTVR